MARWATMLLVLLALHTVASVRVDTVDPDLTAMRARTEQMLERIGESPDQEPQDVHPQAFQAPTLSRAPAEIPAAALSESATGLSSMPAGVLQEEQSEALDKHSPARIAASLSGHGARRQRTEPRFMQRGLAHRVSIGDELDGVERLTMRVHLEEERKDAAVNERIRRIREERDELHKEMGLPPTPHAKPHMRFSQVLPEQQRAKPHPDSASTETKAFSGLRKMMQREREEEEREEAEDQQQAHDIRADQLLQQLQAARDQQKPQPDTPQLQRSPEAVNDLVRKLEGAERAMEPTQAQGQDDDQSILNILTYLKDLQQALRNIDSLSDSDLAEVQEELQSLVPVVENFSQREHINMAEQLLGMQKAVSAERQRLSRQAAETSSVVQLPASASATDAAAQFRFSGKKKGKDGSEQAAGDKKGDADKKVEALAKDSSAPKSPSTTAEVVSAYVPVRNTVAGDTTVQKQPPPASCECSPCPCAALTSNTVTTALESNGPALVKPAETLPKGCLRGSKPCEEALKPLKQATQAQASATDLPAKSTPSGITAISQQNARFRSRRSDAQQEDAMDATDPEALMAQLKGLMKQVQSMDKAKHGTHKAPKPPSGVPTTKGPVSPINAVVHDPNSQLVTAEEVKDSSVFPSTVNALSGTSSGSSSSSSSSTGTVGKSSSSRAALVTPTIVGASTPSTAATAATAARPRHNPALVSPIIEPAPTATATRPTTAVEPQTDTATNSTTAGAAPSAPSTSASTSTAAAAVSPAAAVTASHTVPQVITCPGAACQPQPDPCAAQPQPQHCSPQPDPCAVKPQPQHCPCDQIDGCSGGKLTSKGKPRPSLAQDPSLDKLVKTAVRDAGQVSKTDSQADAIVRQVLSGQK